VRNRLAGFAVFSLIILMIIPVYADVDKAEIDKETFTIDGKFTISGTVSEPNRVFVFASLKGPSGEKLFRNTQTDPGTFSFIPIDADNIFKSKGEYTIQVFTDVQNVANATVIKLFYDNGVISLVPDYVLELKKIGNKTIDETEKLSFTASVTDSTIEEIEYILEKYPSGATINKDTGVFSWTPTDTQYGKYVFDVVVKSGPLEDRETITVTVNDKPEPEQTQTEPEPSEPKELGIAPFVDESKDPQSYVDRYNNESSYKKWFDDNYSEYSSIYEAVGLDEQLEIPAPFVDESKDPQSYVDRYNNEVIYKTWFDDNYSEYSSIYEAVGLDEPKELAPFVDPNLDPQYYIDRYNKEITYKDWFDKTFPDITIYKAVGLDEPVIEEPEFGECGKGTKLIDGKCTIVATESKGGGCLIATAAYGSEMAPQVQLLREIRDNQLMKTESGVSFMTGFNQFYYSFSPYIADMQRENPVFQEVVKIGITPLLSSLSIMSNAESESQVIGYGIGVILMNIGMYFAAPVMLFYGIRKVRRVRF